MCEFCTHCYSNLLNQQVPILEGEESDGDVPRLGKSSTLIISAFLLSNYSFLNKL